MKRAGRRRPSRPPKIRSPKRLRHSATPIWSRSMAAGKTTTALSAPSISASPAELSNSNSTGDSPISPPPVIHFRETTMAHPYHHSLSSVKKWGGTVADYQHIHDWFDASKAIIADFRHRALRSEER